MPIRRRVFAATLVVALIAVVVTAVASLQLLRSADADETRATLAAQATQLADARPAVREGLVSGLSELD